MTDTFVYCSRCGTQNAATAQFCQKCGSAMAPASTPALVPAAPLAPVAVGAAPVVAYAPPVAPAVGANYAGFWIRVAAYLLDAVIMNILFVPIFIIFLLPSFIKAINQINAEEPPVELFTTLFLMIPVIWIVQWLYDALTTCSPWQGTVGKKVLRLKVTDEAGNRISFARATGRFFGKLLSHMIMDIGFIMVAFTDRKQGLHDMIASTLVTRY
jgi:uncharacterized RDD family membrane protein YckC